MMTLDPTRLLVAFKEAIPRADAEKLFAGAGLVLEDANDSEQDRAARPFEIVNHTDRRFWVRSSGDKPITQDQFNNIEATLAGNLDWIGPVYRIPNTPGRGGLLSPLPNVLVIKPTTQLGPDTVKGLSDRLANLGLREIPEKSQYLGDYRYYILPDIKERTAYQLQPLLLEQEKDLIGEAQFENMPMVVPITVVPNDPFFGRQWSMTRIRAGGPGTTGWDISTGAPGVVICILDQGCDLSHPDLSFSTQGINLGTMMPTGAPTGPHGTACAGIAAAMFNNAEGVAGVAGSCNIMPVAFQNWTDVECAAGINWAANNGANVISMSFGEYAPGEGFGPTGWNFAIIDPAINNAVNVQGCVLCAATGNENTGTVNRYPARNPLVIAVGGSDQADNRKTPASADGECWGANFGPGISVVAPCVLNPTTDIQGTGGYNANNGGARMVACVNYPSCGDSSGDYFFQFNGTSSATPHVSGFAALIRSACPTWTNIQVRDRIEQTADKVGGAYANVPGFPNGTRNAEMGYGRVNVLRALQKTVPAISWVPMGIVYGTALGPAQLNATASVPGTFTYAPPAGTCLPAGPHTLSATFTPDDTCSYTTATATAVLNVSKATPIINWANPPDIDFGTPLDNTQLDASATWVVCGNPITVAGTFVYTPGAGTVLPVGTQTLCVVFTPTDTVNYDQATDCVQINVLTGNPIVLSCSFAPTTLQREERTQVIVLVKNDSVKPHGTQGPNPGFEYSEGDTYQTKGFLSTAGAYRIAVDLDMTPYPYKVHYLYRWGFGHTLAPGEVVSVNGYIRFHNSRENAPYFVAMIQEVDTVLLDHQCPTPITVQRP